MLPKRIKRKDMPAYLVDPDTGCWEWQKAISSTGYGNLWVDGKLRLAHRHYYEIHKGPIPEGMHIDHLCSNPSCVNPDHLEAVTRVENLRRGRGTKLTLAEVATIRELSNGMTQKDIAARFGVSQTQVSMIVRRLNWKDVA